MLESYIQALLRLISLGRITEDYIKDEEYKAEVERRRKLDRS